MSPRPTHQQLPREISSDGLGCDSVTAAMNIPLLLRGAVDHPAEILLLVDFPGGQSVIAVNEGDVLELGRADECDIVLTSERVSRKHARFTCADGVLSVTDLGSRNGTLVDGRKVDRAKLDDNAIVLVGAHSIVVHYPWRAQRTVTLAEYLARMPALHAVAQGAGKDFLANTKVFLIHHLTSEVLGLIAALRAMGCRDLETLFVVYAGEVPEAYLHALRGLPDDEFHCAALTNHPVRTSVEGAYDVSNRFSPIRNRAEVRDALWQQPLNYFDAMQRLAVVRLFAQLERAESAGQRCLLIEDGGYLAPFLNDVALAGLTVQEVRGASCTDARRVAEVLDRALIGTVEHTRSGHDRVVAVEARHRRLARPAISIAVSNYKTQIEPREVAATIVNGVENVLHMIGKTLSRRHCVVLGSCGAVGASLAQCLKPRLIDPATQLAGVDPRAVPGAVTLEATSLHALPEETREAMDLVIGAVGRSSLAPTDVVAWLAGNGSDELILASGSSKTDEFRELAAWLSELTEQAAPVLDGQRLAIATADIVDPKTERVAARRVRMRLGNGREKSLVLLANLMPINFLFYGVPTETIDGVLAELLGASVRMMRSDATEPLNRRLYMVDKDLFLDP